MTMCQALTTEAWGEEAGLEEESLLHLAASLGLSRLVCSLLHWAAEHPGKRIGREVDALARDQHGSTPLVGFFPKMAPYFGIFYNMRLETYKS